MNENEEVEEDNQLVRQINLSSLNESVNLMSSDPNEDMIFLSNIAVELLKEVKKRNGSE